MKIKHTHTNPHTQMTWLFNEIMAHSCEYKFRENVKSKRPSVSLKTLILKTGLHSV